LQFFGSIKFCPKTTLLIKSPRRCWSVQEVINRGARPDVQWGEGMGMLRRKCHQ
jgi:hypothetical protein